MTIHYKCRHCGERLESYGEWQLHLSLHETPSPVQKKARRRTRWPTSTK